MTQPDVSIGLEAKGEVAVEYGAYRRAVAEWAGIAPADVTAGLAGRFDIAYEEENNVSWAYAHRTIQEVSP